MHSNYANEMTVTLYNLTKTLDLNDQIYYPRGIVVFNSRLRIGLKVINGHYNVFSYSWSNSHWEMYNDLTHSVKVKPTTTKKC